MALTRAPRSRRRSYTLLVQQWPATESRSAEENFFTLHGNWPTYNDGSYPCECGGSFDPNEISSISSDMNKFWPSFRGSNDDFWSHEWTKHGTCASSSPYLKGELNFFSNTLKARASFDIYDALTKGGLQTGTRVSLSDVHSALRQAFGHDGVVGCTGGALDSISLCLTPDLDATDCPSNQSDSGCSSSIEWSAPSRR